MKKNMGQKSLGIGLPRALNRKTQTRSLRILDHHQRGIGYIQFSIKGQATGRTDSFGGSGNCFPESPLLLASSRTGRDRHKASSGKHDSLCFRFAPETYQALIPVIHRASALAITQAHGKEGSGRELPRACPPALRQPQASGHTVDHAAHEDSRRVVGGSPAAER